MPLVMDVHRNVSGLTPEKLAEEHQKDLAVQAKYGVDFRQYWYSEKEGAVFCLCEAPSKEAAAAVHQEAHGAGPDEIYEVKEGI